MCDYGDANWTIEADFRHRSDTKDEDLVARVDERPPKLLNECPNAAMRHRRVLIANERYSHGEGVVIGHNLSLLFAHAPNTDSRSILYTQRAPAKTWKTT